MNNFHENWFSVVNTDNIFNSTCLAVDTYWGGGVNFYIGNKFIISTFVDSHLFRLLTWINLGHKRGSQFDIRLYLYELFFKIFLRTAMVNM